MWGSMYADLGEDSGRKVWLCLDQAAEPCLEGHWSLTRPGAQLGLLWCQLSQPPWAALGPGRTEPLHMAAALQELLRAHQALMIGNCFAVTAFSSCYGNPSLPEMPSRCQRQWQKP